MPNYSCIDARNYHISKEMTCNPKLMGTTNRFFNTGYLSEDVINAWKLQANLPSNSISNMCYDTNLNSYCKVACGSINSCDCDLYYDANSRYYPVKSVSLPYVDYPKNNDCTRFVKSP